MLYCLLVIVRNWLVLQMETVAMGAWELFEMVEEQVKLMECCYLSREVRVLGS